MAQAILTVVPWKEVIRSAPAIIESARKLYASLSERHRNRGEPSSTTDPESLPALAIRVSEVQQRMDALDADQSTQAELVSRMAVQEEAL